MKSSRKEVKEEKRCYDDRFITCPRCRTMVSYERRAKHQCFRRHLMEVEREIARMGWANATR